MKRFNALINAMPLDEQAFTSKKSTWSKYFNNYDEVSNILKQIFKEKDIVQISRADLFKLAQKGDLGHFIISTIIWGYPRGMRGNHFIKIASNFQQLNKVLLEAREGVCSWIEHFNRIQSIEGLGLSTYSKLLYFLSVEIENYPALILDKRIIDTLQKKLFLELKPIENINMYNSITKYPLYLKTVHDLSQSIDAEGGKIEMFLFEFGLNLKLNSAK